MIYKRYFQRFWQFLPITRLSITPTTPVDESADEDVSLLCAPQPPDELLLEVLSWQNNEDGNGDADDYEGGNVDEPIDMIIIDIVDMIIIDIVDIIIVDIVDIIFDIVDMITIDIVDMITIDIVDMTRWNGTSMGSSCASCQIAPMEPIAATWSVLFFRDQHQNLNFEQVDHNVHKCRLIFQPCDNRNNYKGPEQSDFGERPEDLSWKLLLSGSLLMSDKPLISILFKSTKNVFLCRAKTGPDGGLFLTQVIWLTKF